MASATDHAAPAPATQSLYASGPRIQARGVLGRHALQRWGMVALTQAVFYGMPWLRWHGRQAVLFDILGRRFHLFGLTLWPQDFILLTGLLVVSALALFLFTALFGRLWCGYTCPQTVYTSLFMLVERLFEGDWRARQKLDRSPLDGRKLLRRGGKHLAWGALAFWTGTTFVGYFTPIRTLVPALAGWQLGPWEGFWVLFYGFATYGNAGWMREQVCKYMCPYARFQGVMMDADTITVTYDAGRGEPRGGRARSAAAAEHGLGGCLDCRLCVQVCPMGIDIRDGLQIECLNCGLCVDACNGIMKRQGYPGGLVRYTSQRALTVLTGAGSSRGVAAAHPLLRRRVLAYGSILALVAGVLATALVLRAPVRLDVMRDRAVLARDTDDGWVENVYRLQVMNLTEQPHRLVVRASGVPGLRVRTGSGVAGADGHPGGLLLAGLGTLQVAVDVDADPAVLQLRHTPIVLEVTAEDDPTFEAHARTQLFSPLTR